MKKNIFELMQDTVDNVSYTENGMKGYKTTKHPLVDVNFAISSFRKKSEADKVSAIKSILTSKDADYALRFMMYVRDARNGLGERDLVKSWLKVLVNASFENKDAIMSDIITKYIPTYGRYDDLLVFLGTAYEDMLIDFIKNQLKEDYANMMAGKSISLLAKWMPSNNTSSKETKALANKLANKLGATPKDYRKTLSTLRKKLDVLEIKTSANNWNEINYNAVPSKANLKYKNAFLRHDEDRRRDYLAKLRVGDSTVKINGGVNFPHEIVHAYCERGYWRNAVNSFDETLEQLWKALKNVDGLDNTIVVRDGSGSMTCSIDNNNITALDVSSALAIYCAERLKGDFKNKFMTFSAKAEVVDLTNCNSLHTKLQKLEKYDDCSNTNIANVFDTILETAVNHHLSPDELPARVLIISDMEFDGWGGFNSNSNVFEHAAQEYKLAGYKLPKLIFWNVASRTNTIPCKENENGVILVSGFSQNVLRLVSTGKTDPFDALVDELDKTYSNIPLLKMLKTEKSNQSKNLDTPYKSKFLG